MSLSARKITFCSMSVALAVVASMITIYRFPFGGSVTPCCMLFVVLPAWFYGPWVGIINGCLYGFLQFLLNPCFLTVPQFLFDYILAFGVMGIAGFFGRSYKGLIFGYLTATVGRWIMASIAGLIWIAMGSQLWSGWDPLPYTMAYNACYIYAEAIGTIILLLLPVMRKGLEKVRSLAVI